MRLVSCIVGLPVSCRVLESGAISPIYTRFVFCSIVVFNVLVGYFCSVAHYFRYSDIMNKLLPITFDHSSVARVFQFQGFRFG